MTNNVFFIFLNLISEKVSATYGSRGQKNDEKKRPEVERVNL